MWVLGTNVLARGITDSSIACGAAAALALGAWRVEAGAMSLTALLVILMLGVEIFRPMRELRTVLHQGMVGMSAAQGIYQILDDRPAVADAPPAALAAPLTPAIAFEGVGFHYPGARRAVLSGLDFARRAGRAHRHRRLLGRRQILHRAAAAALLRSRAGPVTHRRPRSAQLSLRSRSAR